MILLPGSGQCPESFVNPRKKISWASFRIFFCYTQISYVLRITFSKDVLMTRLPLTTQTLYAELLELLTADEAQRSIGHLSGTFTDKTVRGHCYVYFQYSVPGGGKKQVFLGRKDPVLDKIAADFAQSRELRTEERRTLQRLCAQLNAGGVVMPDAATGRVLEHLAAAGLFRQGVLVGTHAFNQLGTLLGVKWAGGQQTEDIDIASQVQLAVGGAKIDFPELLDRLQMGFLPVPGLDPRSPTTSFKVRGRSLRVDLLCPDRTRESEGPVLIPALQAAAQPLPYLDFVMADAQRAALIYGAGVLVAVPSPARFALHKLLVSRERQAAWQTKAEKDLQQAAELLDVLLADRPGDLLMAWDDVVGRNWQKKVLAGIEALYPRRPVVADRLKKLLGE